MEYVSQFVYRIPGCRPILPFSRRCILGYLIKLYICIHIVYTWCWQLPIVRTLFSTCLQRNAARVKWWKTKSSLWPVCGLDCDHFFVFFTETQMCWNYWTICYELCSEIGIRTFLSWNISWANTRFVQQSLLVKEFHNVKWNDHLNHALVLEIIYFLEFYPCHTYLFIC